MKIIYKTETNIAIVHPTGEVPIEILMTTVVPEEYRHTARIVEDNIIPSDRTFRDAWDFDDDKIFDFIKSRIEDNSTEYLIYNRQNEQMKYNNYLNERFLPIMEQLNMKHKPHDCRHTFATLLNNAGANGTSIKKLA